jgi:UDPglucose 6-dehydrogenase
MKIAVIGSGYVGLVAAACFAEIGHEVVCVDNDPGKLNALRNGETPIHEQFLTELLSRHRAQRLQFTEDLSNAVKESAVTFIAVGTPASDTGEADLSYVEAVSREIAHSIHGYKVIVEKSTVPVYTNNWIRSVIAQTGADGDFDVVSNPEFLREGSAVTDFLYPDRIVIGTDSDRAAALLKQIYAPLTSGSYGALGTAIPNPESAKTLPKLIHTSTKSAELIKHASNAFLALKISFINAVANLCESVGADIEEVSEGLGADSRIGPRFLRAGIGYGGSCFPKDLAAFRAVAREVGYEFQLLDEVSKINEEQKQRFMRKVRASVWNLKGKRLAVLGLAFKGGTDDIRESPAIALIQMLLKEGSEIVAFDPAGIPAARKLLGEQVTFAEDSYAASNGADALLILTDWDEFKSLDLSRLRGMLKYPNVIDGRNLYDPEQMSAFGFNYVSMGRAPIEANFQDRSGQQSAKAAFKQ